MEITPVKRPSTPLQSNLQKRKRWYNARIEISPPSRREEEEDEEPVLVLKPFSQFPHISFDKVVVGSSKTITLRVQNPSNKPQHVKVEKFPHSRGFSVDSLNFTVYGGDDFFLDINWLPSKVGSCRESITFRTDSGIKTQVFVLGNACSPPKKKKLQKRRSGGGSTKILTRQKNINFSYGPMGISGKENMGDTQTFTMAFTSGEKQIEGYQGPEGVKRPSFFLKGSEESYAPSPVRRQTFIINKMFGVSSRSALQDIPVPNEFKSPGGSFVFSNSLNDSSAVKAFPKEQASTSDSLEHSPESLPLEDSLLSPSNEADDNSTVEKNFESQKTADDHHKHLPIALNIDDENHKLILQEPDAQILMTEQKVGRKCLNVEAEEPFKLQGTFSKAVSRPLGRGTFCLPKGEQRNEGKSEHNVENKIIGDQQVGITSDVVSPAQDMVAGSFKIIQGEPKISGNKKLVPVDVGGTTFNVLPVKLSDVPRGAPATVTKKIWGTFRGNTGVSSTSTSTSENPSSETSSDPKFQKSSESENGILDLCGRLERSHLSSPENNVSDRSANDHIQLPPSNHITETPAASKAFGKATMVCSMKDTEDKIFNSMFLESLSDHSPSQSSEAPDCVQRCSTGIALHVPELKFPLESPTQEVIEARCHKSKQPISESDLATKTEKLHVVKSDEKPAAKPPPTGRKSLSAGSKRPVCRKIVTRANPTPQDMKKKTLKQSLFKTPTSLKVKRPPVHRDKQARYSSPKGKVRLEAQATSKEKPYQKKAARVSSAAKAAKALIAPKTLNLIKRRPSDKTRHPNPFAAKNMYYDERWMEKQETSFTRWLNFVLTPPDELKTSGDAVKVDAGKLWVESMKDNMPVCVPTKEDISLKAYTATRRMNMLRRAACKLYQSEQVVAVIRRVEIEVEHKKIIVRKDRALHADFGIKKHILGLLMCYNPLWLRIGLETVYGEIILLQSNEDLHGLSRFIGERFLGNPDIAFKYAHPAVLNFFKPGYEEALKEFTLKKFLLLVYFLDFAKTSRLIDHNPCLFRKNAEYKASRDLLLVFSREYLSGEGDITRHLKYLGYTVSHQQSMLEEFDYAVTNISVDLRCGLRLCRVLELLLHNWNLCSSLRLPAVSRLQKVHNNEVALKAFIDAGYDIEGDITARDIVDGHREKTLSFLWQIIFKTQISKLLDKKMLKDEIAYLQRTLQFKADVAAFNAIRMPLRTTESCRANFVRSDLYTENECVRLLLFWCQAVCGHYNLKVHNVTTSFADGRVLCFLLHHYHPQILPLSAISQQTTSSCFEESDLEQSNSDNDDNGCLGNELSSFKTGALDPSEVEQLLKNERQNLKLAFEKFQEIGGIPILSRPTDMSNTIPDEKVVITLVAYLNIRLMDLSKEIKAARVIQLAWRKHQLRKKQERLKVEIEAAKVIQRAVRQFLERKHLEKMQKSALVIQTAWRVVKAKKTAEALRHEKHMRFLASKAVVIQAVYRGYKARKDFQRKRQACIVLQSVVRCWLQQSHYGSLRRMVVKLQQRFRAKVLGRRVRKDYLALRSLTIVLQAYSRGLLFRRDLETKKRAALIIQCAVRGWLARSQYQKTRSAVMWMQRMYRSKLIGRRCRVEYVKLRTAAVCIQNWYRNSKKHQKENCAAKVIQAYYRRHRCKKRYMRVMSATVCVQRMWRAHCLAKQQRHIFLATKQKIIMIQSCIRQYIARKRYLRTRWSIVVIQKNVRRLLALRGFFRCRQSVVLIQVRWKACIQGRKARNEFISVRRSVIVIQAWIRMKRARAHYVKLKSAVAIIEVRWKARCEALNERKKYLNLRQSAIKIQSAYRGHICRKQLKEMRDAAVIIQSLVRTFLVRKELALKKQAATTIKNFYMSYRETCRLKSEYQKTRHSVILIQALFRGNRVRKQVNHWHECAVLIQSLFRKYVCRKRFIELRSAAIVVQRRFRANALMKRTVQEYQRNKTSAVIIQSAFRGYLVRQEIKQWHASALVIQSHFRKLVCRKRYMDLRSSAIIIQKRYRAKCSMKVAVKEYQNIKSAAIVIQSTFRGYLTRKELSMQHRSASLIQRYFRTFLCRKQFLKLRSAAVYLQQRYRAKNMMRLEWQNYQKVRKSVVIIQSSYRGHVVRKEVKSWHRSAVVIQSFFKGYICRKHFLQLCSAAIAIQRRFRANCMMKRDQQAFQEIKRSTVIVQAAFRGHMSRKEIILWHRSATIIQSHFRGFLQRKRFLKLHQAAVILQKWFRAKCLMQAEFQKYQRTKQAVIVIQSSFRGFIARRQIKYLNRSAVVVQSHFRKFIARKHYLEIQSATTVFQRRFRANCKMRNDFNQYQKMKKSAITIQSVFRGYLARKQFQKIKAAVTIQSVFRMHLCRKRYLQARVLITRVQAVVRMKPERRKYVQQYHAVLFLQHVYRNKLQTRGVREQFLKEKRACITLQSWYRCISQHQKYLAVRQKVVLIQAVVRAFILRKKYLRMKEAATKIQRFWKAIMSARHQKERMNAAAVCIQSAYRAYHDRKLYLRQLHCLISLQSYIRGHLARRKFLVLKLRHSSAFIIQNAFRVYLAKKELQRLRRARKKMLDRISRAAYAHLMAICIQRAYRHYLMRKEAQKHTTAVIFIQRWFRAKRQRLWFLRLHRSLCYFQRSARCFLQRREVAAIRIQACVKSWLVRQKLKKEQEAAKRIQAVWRGYRLRCFIINNKVKEAREKIQLATARASEEMKLFRRTSLGLDYLLKYRSLAHVINAVNHLDTSTRFSAVCCEQVAKMDGAAVLIQLINSCNRSIPHMDIIRCSISILLNLAKYEKTVSYVWEAPGSVTTILDMMRIFREKGSSIFTKCCSLLWIMSQDPVKAAALKTNSIVVDQITSFHYLVMRKKKIEDKRLQTKARMSEMHSSSFASSTFSTPRPKKSLQIQPDWMLGNQVMREFSDPVRAICALMKTLQLKSKAS